MEFMFLVVGILIGALATGLNMARAIDKLVREKIDLKKESSQHASNSVDIKRLLIRLLEARGWKTSHRYDDISYYSMPFKSGKEPKYVEVKSLHDAVMIEIGRG